MNNRLKNYGLWVSVASLFLLSLKSSGVDVDLGVWNQIIDRVLEIAVLLGIVNNPDTDTKGFSDDNKGGGI